MTSVSYAYWKIGKVEEHCKTSSAKAKRSVDRERGPASPLSNIEKLS
jgi:hypothetical protein